MINKYIAITMATLVCVSIFAGGFIPVIADATTTTTTVTNEGAGWLRMNYDPGLTKNFSINVSLEDDTLIVGAQTGEASDMILYSDDTNSVVLVDGVMYLVDSTGAKVLPNSFTIERSLGVVKLDGEEISAGSVYTYYPNTSGNYAYFEVDSAPIQYSGEYFSAMGTFAGVIATENYSPYGLEINADLSSDEINSVMWALPGAEDISLDTILPITIPGGNSTLPYNPPGDDNIDLNPIDLGDLNDGAGIMTVPPTPDYTDGDWGYSLSSGKAKITAYSGPSDIDIDIPSTVGGYDVAYIGNNSYRSIFDTSLSFGSLTIPSSVIYINASSFENSSGFTGTLTIPSGITGIGSSAFRYCSGFTGTLTIPSSITSIGDNAFERCSGFTGLVVLSDATPSNSTFKTTSNIKEVLNLGNATYTTTSYGLDADEVRSDIPGAGFLAPITITEERAGSGPANVIVGLAPVIVGAGLVLGVLTVMVIRRF